jgi:hypothetical protein
VEPTSTEVVIIMRREANTTDAVVSPRTCEIDKTLSGGAEGGECHNLGEVLYREALLCEPHATLLGLEDRAEAVLGSVLRMDEWLEGNGSPSADEEFVMRVRHERDEAVGALRLMREEIRNARKALQG